MRAEQEMTTSQFAFVFADYSKKAPLFADVLNEVKHFKILSFYLSLFFFDKFKREMVNILIVTARLYASLESKDSEMIRDTILILFTARVLCIHKQSQLFG